MRSLQTSRDQHCSLPNRENENEACAHIEIIKPKQLTTKKVLLDSSAMSESSPSGGVEGPLIMKIDYKEILKILIAVFTAIAGTLGVVSCMA